ncbi:MAG: biopolymer transporter ExbD [Hyphomonadaceae bacterium]
MAMLMPKGGGRRRRRGQMADINVTPLVDVMLVLLVVFMITAPMLTTGVTVDLPRTRAQPLPASNDRPIVVSINAEGTVFVGSQEEPVALDVLGAMLGSAAQNDFEKRIHIRGDEAADFGKVAAVLALIQAAGFRNVALVTDPNSLPRQARNGG